MSSPLKAQVQIHFCVLLWGFTAILGKLISLSALSLVWWRLLMVVAMLALWPRVWRGLRHLPLHRIAVYAGIGAILSLHWLTFYAAIKLANASVGVSCIATAPLFIALIEPLAARRPIAARDVLLGLAVIPGVVLLVGGVPTDMHLGIVVGVLSAALVAVFGTLNKRWVDDVDAVVITAIELGAGLLTISLLALLWPGAGPVLALPTPRDLSLLLVLALGCTLVPFVLSLVALRALSAFTAQLAVNLEPVYAVGIAMLLFGEQRELGWPFYLGLLIVLAAVFIHPLLRPRKPATPDLALGVSD